MAVKSNRQLLTKGKGYATQQQKKFGTDEVSFDKDSRLDYLTGFHKRKLQRQKKAQENIKEQERLLKIEERKKVRDERKKQMDEQMRRFKETLDIQAEIEELRDGKKRSDPQDHDSDNSWQGFEDDESDDDDSVKPILKTNSLGTAIYEDETTVEIESLEPNENFAFLAKTNNVELEKSEKILDQSITRAKKYAKFLGMDDSKDNKKKSKKKFRYLTKNERKNNQRKAYQNKHRR
ncbi:similar to Saccharomyces cerevisiae YDR412W RRP17 Component of the pre-60S pre-ribosomal particle [Maudiozyma saulgeensis]|uniref:Similar to Saccharomyces cerevisiae YDR412W RRP17 Component of the pre-60S pre-ribosomal particle n=1 Tax=Maudiozyma saulgeensis TaxID=1789683 RepID=A0A1X7R2G0_9SACH|nr:similar to Saccharomyces cerevisiae YDR412W RRP17 Component of the pre-60S pre-ribosomal particle [Kazachstania saulgeensis]